MSASGRVVYGYTYSMLRYIIRRFHPRWAVRKMKLFIWKFIGSSVLTKILGTQGKSSSTTSTSSGDTGTVYRTREEKGEDRQNVNSPELTDVQLSGRTCGFELDVSNRLSTENRWRVHIPTRVTYQVRTFLPKVLLRLYPWPSPKREQLVPQLCDRWDPSYPILSTPETHPRSRTGVPVKVSYSYPPPLRKRVPISLSPVNKPTIRVYSITICTEDLKFSSFKVVKV